MDYVKVRLRVDSWKRELHGVVETGVTSNTGFRGFRVDYQLEISPAPGTATFADVTRIAGGWDE